MNNDDKLIEWINSLQVRKCELLDKIENTEYNDVVRLRNLAASEHGIEMTPQEVMDLIKMMELALD